MESNYDLKVLLFGNETYFYKIWKQKRSPSLVLYAYLLTDMQNLSNSLPYQHIMHLKVAICNYCNYNDYSYVQRQH